MNVNQFSYDRGDESAADYIGPGLNSANEKKFNKTKMIG